MLANFVKQNYFENIGIFGYSDQEKAKSFKLKNKVNQKIIEERKQILASVQFENVIKNNKAKIGKEFEVFVEDVDKNTNTNNNLSGYVEEFVNMAKKVDVNKVQEGITSLQKTLSLFGELFTNKEASGQGYNPRPLYRRFED